MVPGTEPEPGLTNQQAIADADVVERLAAGRCDRSQSCNRIGAGAAYRDRADCMSQNRALVARDVNAWRCPGGIGEVGLSRCEKSLALAHCDMPGQVYTTAAHCELREMCLK